MQQKPLLSKSIYEFFWDGGGFLLEINAEVNTVKQLLNEYRISDPEEYNNVGWVEFLEKKGYEVRELEPDHQIYF